MLEAYKQGMVQEKQLSRITKMFSDVFEHVWPKRPAFQFSMALIFLVVGISVGIFLSSQGQNGAQITALHNEVQDMQQALAISLLDRPSASKRLQGVSISSRMDSPDSKTLEALLYTLDNDPNVNVRLAAVDALYLFHDYPEVKEGLLRSLGNQPSPLVQVALIDLIVNMRERQAVEALRMLLQDERLNPDVKQYAERGLQQLSF
jgi:HEAT repeat protein